MKLYEIISNMKFIGIKYYKDVEIESLTCSSGEKCVNSIYFCIKGLKQDGHNFASEAIQNGAVCLVVERFLDIPITQILVENSRVAMSYISSVFYSTYKSKMKFIGVTGTNGKTTTTFLLREILTNLNHKVGLIGTEGIYINNLMLPPMLTTPDPIALHKLIREMEDNGCEYCIMEVSAHAIALNKIDNIYFDIFALTNITKDHLDFFLTMENYIKCKASLFSSRHAKAGVVNIDAKHSKGIVKNSDLEILTVGKEGDIKLGGIKNKSDGSEFKLEIKNKTYSGATNLMGEYNVSNVGIAVATLYKLGFDPNTILTTLKNSQIEVPGRFNLLKTDADYSVIVDYAHTPDGIKNVLGEIKNLPHNHIITVFGCGGNRDKTKRNEMGEVASKLSDYVIVTSDNPRDENPELIIDDILNNLDAKNIARVTDRREAIEHALSVAEAGDIVAILGKGAENYQEIKGVKYPFSDFDVVKNYFKIDLKGKVKV